MAEKAKTPSIRFKGFTDDWEQRKLGDLCDEFQSGHFISAGHISDTGDYPVFGGNGLRGYTSTYNHDGLYALIGRQGALCGNMNISSGKAYFTEHAVVTHANKMNDTQFLFYLFGLMNLGQYSGQSAQPGLAVNKLIEIKILVPQLPEQQKIAFYFTHLDNLITLHQRKFEKLQNVKKAMLEKMFPKNGSNVPELRFAGFTDAWEQHKLVELFQVGGSGGTPNTSKSEYYGGVIPFLGISDISNSSGYIVDTEKHITELGLKNSAAWIVPKESISLAMYASVGKVAILKADISTSQAFYNMIFDDLTIRDFVYQYLVKTEFENGWNNLISTGTQANLNAEKVKNFEITMSASKQERYLMGEFFSRIDNLINLHQRKLEKLQNVKKACLEKMFVQERNVIL